MAVGGIGGLRPAKRRDRGLALAELFTDVAEREPGRGEVRRKLDRLQQQIGGGGRDRLSAADRARNRTGGRPSGRREDRNRRDGIWGTD